MELIPYKIDAISIVSTQIAVVSDVFNDLASTWDTLVLVKPMISPSGMVCLFSRILS